MQLYDDICEDERFWRSCAYFPYDYDGKSTYPISQDPIHWEAPIECVRLVRGVFDKEWPRVLKRKEDKAIKCVNVIFSCLRSPFNLLLVFPVTLKPHMTMLKKKIKKNSATSSVKLWFWNTRR